MIDRNRPEEDPAEGSRRTVERQLDQPEKGTNQGEGGKKSGVERDADGQYARTDKGRTNDGVASADPRALSGDESGDATWPLKQDRGDG